MKFAIILDTAKKTSISATIFVLFCDKNNWINSILDTHGNTVRLTIFNRPDVIIRSFTSKKKQTKSIRTISSDEKRRKIETGMKR